MMSLVAYGSDDEEDEGTEEQEMQVEVNGPPSKPVVSNNFNDTTAEPTSSSTSGTSALKFDAILPKPKYKTNLLLESDPVPPKKVYGDEESMPKPPAAGSSTLTSGFGLSSFGKLEKGAGGKVRITIPSLKDFENDEEDDKSARKIYQPPKKGSGLFAILPEPKLSSYLQPKKTQQPNDGPSSSTSASSNAPANAKPSSLRSTTTITTSNNNNPTSVPSLVPQQTLKRPLSPTSANKRLAQVRAKYMKQEIDCIKFVSKKDRPAEQGSSTTVQPQQNKRAAAHVGEDSDEDEESDVDFFSLDSSTRDDDEITPMEAERVPSPVFFSSERLNATAQEGQTEDERLPSASFGQPSQQGEEDIMKYIQAEGGKKGKRGAAPVNVIDINADDLRPASTEWLKAISDTSMVPPRKVNLPGGLSKRKHQITYLAAEAKAREEELQNMWAANRHTRRQTQSKYGF